MRIVLIDLHTVKPKDESAILSAAKECGCMVTCKELNVVGGMGCFVGSFLSKTCPIPMRMVGIQNHFGQSGSYVDLQQHYGVTAQAIVDATENVIRKKRKS